MSYLKDQVNIIRHLTIRRFFNLILLRSSYLVARFFKKPILWGKPFGASIEPTTACNLGCPECPSGLKQFTRPVGKIDLEFHKKMLDQLKKSVFYINYYFQGEPFLHPNFLELIRQAKLAKIYTSTSTNAHFISTEKGEEIVKSGLDRLIISIDGASQNTYEQYRIDGNLQKVIEGTKHIIEAKRRLGSSTPHIIFQMLVVKPNEHERLEVLKIGRELGVDEVRFKSAQFYEYENGNPLMPSDDKYSRYRKQKNGTYKLKYELGNRCWRMWSSTVLTWDGKIVPCCFDKDAKHVVGDLKNSSFEQIWGGTEMVTFRKSILSQRNDIDICKNCSEGAKVWV